MKRLVFFMLTAGMVLRAEATSTIDAVNHNAYGANIGWMDWRGDTNNGAIIGEYVCSGYIYSANVGWINLGNGSPANQLQYQNNSATDFGVNQDGLGNLRGYAYGANIGWIAFEDTGAPKVDLFTGNLSGSVWSSNCGWISLSNEIANVRTDIITPGALAPDGLPIAWQLAYFGATNVNANADIDGDGMSNMQEYQSGTNPNDAKDFLRITSAIVSFVNDNDNDNDTLVWTSHPTRQYRVQQCTNLVSATWVDAGVLLRPDSGTNTTRTLQFSGPAAKRFIRVQAIKPLAP